MSDSGIALSEYEATALLPYLVLKVGDSKDAVRQNVRSIFKLLVNIYSPNRLFVFISGGLKSKTNKTRQGNQSILIVCQRLNAFSIPDGIEREFLFCPSIFLLVRLCLLSYCCAPWFVSLIGFSWALLGRTKNNSRESCY